MNYLLHRNRSSGFTLIELAIVITIISLLISSALGMMKVQMAGKAMQETHDRISTVKGAMAAFMVKNGRLPCPAALNAAPGSENFGLEDSKTCAETAPTTTITIGMEGTKTMPGTVRVTNKAIPGPNNTVRIGAVPFVTLGISAQSSMDGWGNRFLYAVSEQLANEGTHYDEMNGAITLLDNGKNISGPKPNHTPFVLISLGQRGYGAYTYQGVPVGNAPCTDAGELQQENCDLNNAIFRSMAYSSTDDPATRFDNILSNDLFAHDPVRVCGDQGMLYGPGHRRADANGCVPDMVESTSGNVGIGTTAPLTRLDVQGEIKIGNSGGECTATTAGSVRNNPVTNLIEYCSPIAGAGNVPAWIALMPVPVLKGYSGWDGDYCYGEKICNPRPASGHFSYGGTCTPEERGLSKIMSAGTDMVAAEYVFTDGIYFCLCGTTSSDSTMECGWIGMQSIPNDGPP